MASTDNSNRGTIFALLCGAVGFGIVIYALLQDETTSQLAQPEATEVVATVEEDVATAKVVEDAPEAVEETTQTASVAKPEDATPTVETEVKPATDDAVLEVKPEAQEEAAPADTADVSEDTAPVVQDTMEVEAPSDVATTETTNVEEAETPEVETVVAQTPEASEGVVEADAAESAEPVVVEETAQSDTELATTTETPNTTETEVARVEPDATEPVEEPVVESEVASVQAETATPESDAPVVDDTVADVETDTTAETQEPAEPVVVAAVPEGADEAPDLDANDPSVPKFDLVRVEADGSAVIAGRAAPNAEVKVFSNGKEIGTAMSSSKGEFVALIQTEVTETAQSLALLAENPSGPTVASRSSVILLGREAPVNSDGTGETVSLPPAIIQTNRDEVRVIQPVVGLADLDRVSLDSISYDQEGQVILAGRGRPANTARIYADQTAIADIEISRGGTWSVVLNDLDAGRYTLRVDELDAEGKVLSRVESPFQREFPTAEKLALLSDDKQVIVQPGNNLWTIAELRYGKGFRYTVIFEANKEQIRDPDLIYPGQVFALPTEE